MIPIRLWLALGAAAAVLAAGAWWHLSLVHKAEQAVHAHYATVLAEISAKTAKAAEQFRATEASWQDKLDAEAKDGQVKIAQAQRDAASARAAADRLRDAASRRAAARTTQDPGAAGRSEGQSGADPIDLFAKLLSRHTAELVEIGGYADELKVRGLACERAFDALNERPGS